MTLGERINFVRKSNKVSQSAFAMELGISQAHVSKLEKDMEKPSETLLILIAHRFNINIEWLKKEEGTPEKFINWDCSDNGLEAKYMYFKSVADDRLNFYKGFDRQCFVEAFGYFITLLSAPDLNEQEKSQYLQAIHSLTNKLERIQFQSYLYPKIDGSRKNVNYEHLFNHITELHTLKKDVISSIDEMLNIYLSKFNLPYKF
ncbi:MAG: helix-turn-helix domain-containing protein [Ruminococcus sp.]